MIEFLPSLIGQHVASMVPDVLVVPDDPKADESASRALAERVARLLASQGVEGDGVAVLIPAVKVSSINQSTPFLSATLSIQLIIIENVVLNKTGRDAVAVWRQCLEALHQWSPDGEALILPEGTPFNDLGNTDPFTGEPKESIRAVALALSCQWHEDCAIHRTPQPAGEINEEGELSFNSSLLPEGAQIWFSVVPSGATAEHKRPDLPRPEASSAQRYTAPVMVGTGAVIWAAAYTATRGWSNTSKITF